VSLQASFLSEVWITPKKIPVGHRSELFTGICPAKTQHELLHLHIPFDVLATFTILIVTTSSCPERHVLARYQRSSLPTSIIVKLNPLSSPLDPCRCRSRGCTDDALVGASVSAMPAMPRANGMRWAIRPVVSPRASG